MKKKSLLLCLLYVLIQSHEEVAGQQVCARGVNPFGFWAEFLFTLNHLAHCRTNNLTPVIYWGPTFAYYCPEGYNGSTNGWEYYFEPVSDARYQPEMYLYTNCYYNSSSKFSTLWLYHQYIQQKHLLSHDEQKGLKPINDHDARYVTDFDWQKISEFPIAQFHLYGKSFRKWVHQHLIKKYIKIKPSISAKIDQFYKKNMAGKKTIGIHLRGTHILNEVLPVPLEAIFNEARQYAKQGYQFFIATDQLPLVQSALENLEGEVIYYECQRFECTTSPYAGTPKLDPKLGEDILIETMLLSRCDHLIHTLSNVSTAALYFNPKLKHTTLY